MTYIEKTPPEFKTDHSVGGVTGKSFAEEGAASAFGKFYIHPVDRNFVDRQPYRRSVRLAPKTWHQLGAVAADVLRATIRKEDEAA